MNKQFRRVVALSIISAFVFASPLGMVAKAEKPSAKGSKAKTTVKRDNRIKEHVKEKIQDKKEREENAKEKNDAKKEKEENIKAKIAEIKNNRPKEDEEKRLEKVKKLEKFQNLLAEIKKSRKDIKVLKEEMKTVRNEMKQLIKQSYSKEELEKLRQRAEEIMTKNPHVKVIQIENILKKKGQFKFDTPPVIKEGRTLIPVRAITEGLGADVNWNGEERKVTVSKGDKEMVFQLDDGRVFVNGEETAIDVPAQIMNNRTIVPLRFIAEQLGLGVDYDEDTGVIEIDEDDTEEEEQIIVEEGQDATVTESVYNND
ncbi:stalk domain-containing protein [Marinisporobacter balticus]|uniref:Copper amine oxidase-like protein n=1 Tax=Marinisporobacter balticus TaxID=2018667 RepID=A0A4R2KYI5_9FIRM|nr:stalk domain-containing protein [Marinisporobacter balticus]TCO76406.1 copper amine oxidase-like protein [Marinisporobacter balticus]